jgi:hypothetical protein
MVPLDRPSPLSAAEHSFRAEAELHWREHDAANPDCFWARAEAAAKQAAAKPDKPKRQRFSFLNFLKGRK